MTDEPRTETAAPSTGAAGADLLDAAQWMLAAVDDLFSSLPFSAPENVAYLASAKLSGPRRELRDALEAIGEAQ